MENNLFGTFSIKDIFEDWESDKDVFTLVYESVKRSSEKISFEDATMIAMQIVRKVTEFNNDMSMNTHNGVSAEDKINGLIDFLTFTDSEEERMCNLHQVKFVFNAFNDRETVRKIENGTSVAELFEEYYKKVCDSDGFTEEGLKAEIKDIFSGLNISSDIIEKFTEGLTKENLLEVSAVLAQDINRYMCIVVARAFEGTSKNLSMDEVISKVYSDTDELELISNALYKGREGMDSTEKFRNVILICVIAIMAVAAIMLFWHVAPEISIFTAFSSSIPLLIVEAVIELFAIVFASFISGFALYKLHDYVGVKMGAYVAEYEYFKEDDAEDNLFIKGLKTFSKGKNTYKNRAEKLLHKSEKEKEMEKHVKVEYE